jgi:hypothetical protein
VDEILFIKGQKHKELINSFLDILRENSIEVGDNVVREALEKAKSMGPDVLKLDTETTKLRMGNVKQPPPITSGVSERLVYNAYFNLRTYVDRLYIPVGHEQNTQQEFLKLIDALGVDHPETLKAWSNWITPLSFSWNEEEILLRHLLIKQKQVLGAEHPDTLKTWGRWASILYSGIDAPESEKEFRKLLDVQRRVLGEEHPDTLDTWEKWIKTLRVNKFRGLANREFTNLMAIRRRR